MKKTLYTLMIVLMAAGMVACESLKLGDAGLMVCDEEGEIFQSFVAGHGLTFLLSSTNWFCQGEHGHDTDMTRT